MLKMLVALFSCIVATQVEAKPKCENLRTLTAAERQKIYDDHQSWLKKNNLENRLDSFESVSEFLGDSLRADFRCVDFQGIDFVPYQGNLSFADFSGARLTGSSILDYRLRGAQFIETDLADAMFFLSDLRGAVFARADLRGASFYLASVQSAIFEPDPAKLSTLLYGAIGLEEMRYSDNPAALMALKEQFKKMGRRDLERQITTAIETTRTNQAFGRGAYLSGAARYVGWELPTRYDLAPERALWLLLILIGLFSIPYYISLRSRTSPHIWRILPRDRLGGNDKELMEQLRVTGWERARYALQFSIYSAFQLGWRDLNVGSWLTRLQSTEYALRGSGWVRTLSGIQSLLSIYLLAMWALTQFGRLFDG